MYMPSREVFKVGDSVFVWDLPARKYWLAGNITSVNGPLSYFVTLNDDRIVRRHVDHILSCSSTTSVPPSTTSIRNHTQLNSQPAGSCNLKLQLMYIDDLQGL